MGQGILQLSYILHALPLLNDGFLAIPKKQSVHAYILQTDMGQVLLARWLVVHLSSFPQFQFRTLG